MATAQKAKSKAKTKRRRPARSKSGNRPASDSETKAATVIRLLKRKNGSTLNELSEATGWQVHSVRGFLSGTVKKRMGLPLLSEATDKGRRYRIAKSADSDSTQTAAS